MLTTCYKIKQWLSSQTKQKIIDVHRTDKYLYIIWGNKPIISKIVIPASVLYCLKESNFADLLTEMNSTITFFYKDKQIGEY